MRTFFAALGATVLATSAIAADLPRKAPAALPVPSVVSWTGFYVGIHAGYSWGRWDGDLTFDPGTGPIAVFDPSHRTIDAHGWLAGGQIGFNYQLNSLVFGLEADASWTNLKGNGSFNTIPGDLIGRSKINLIGLEPFAVAPVLLSITSCSMARQV
jgi:outer membrane immunogenic protein